MIASTFNTSRPKPTVQATIVLHSISKDDFEIVNISFHDKRMDELEKELEKLGSIHQTEETMTEKEKQIYGEIMLINGTWEMAAEDLGDTGEISEEIHEELWLQYPEEMYHSITVDLFYKSYEDYWSGEIDTFVNDYDYEVIESSK